MIKNQVTLLKLNDEKQTSLLNAVLETQEGERKRLAETLNDSVGQVLSAIKLNMHRLDKNSIAEYKQPLLLDTCNLADDCLAEIRHIIQNVLPPVLTDYGLNQALHGLCAKVEQTTGIRIELNTGAAGPRPKPATELALYRIAQELFGNAIKHAEASMIWLTLEDKQGWLILEFKDNGKGFNPDAIKHGFGLKNIESRVQLIKGEMKLYTRPASGTVTTIRVRVD